MYSCRFKAGRKLKNPLPLVSNESTINHQLVCWDELCDIKIDKEMDWWRTIGHCIDLSLLRYCHVYLVSRETKYLMRIINDLHLSNGESREMVIARISLQWIYVHNRVRFYNFIAILCKIIANILVRKMLCVYAIKINMDITYTINGVIT